MMEKFKSLTKRRFFKITMVVVIVLLCIGLRQLLSYLNRSYYDKAMEYIDNYDSYNYDVTYIEKYKSLTTSDNSIPLPVYVKTANVDYISQNIIRVNKYEDTYMEEMPDIRNLSAVSENAIIDSNPVPYLFVLGEFHKYTFNYAKDEDTGKWEGFIDSLYNYIPYLASTNVEVFLTHYMDEEGGYSYEDESTKYRYSVKPEVAWNGKPKSVLLTAGNFGEESQYEEIQCLLTFNKFSDMTFPEDLNLDEARKTDIFSVSNIEEEEAQNDIFCTTVPEFTEGEDDYIPLTLVYTPIDVSRDSSEYDINLKADIHIQHSLSQNDIDELENLWVLNTTKNIILPATISDNTINFTTWINNNDSYIGVELLNEDAYPHTESYISELLYNQLPNTLPYLVDSFDTDEGTVIGTRYKELLINGYLDRGAFPVTEEVSKDLYTIGDSNTRERIIRESLIYRSLLLFSYYQSKDETYAPDALVELASELQDTYVSRASDIDLHLFETYPEVINAVFSYFDVDVYDLQHYYTTDGIFTAYSTKYHYYLQFTVDWDSFDIPQINFFVYGPDYSQEVGYEGLDLKEFLEESDKSEMADFDDDVYEDPYSSGMIYDADPYGGDLEIGELPEFDDSY